MQITTEIKNIYRKIQKKLFYMIPEKWDRVYLYASVIEHFNNVQTGEMFFYYYPKSIFKKNPINVYEVPNKFNLDEQEYLKLAEKLYEVIKELRMQQIKIGEKTWTNITISIENLKFNVEYNYEDLLNSILTNNDRHIIWRYKYLNVPISSYSKKDRRMIENYLLEEEYHNKNITTYSEGIYRKPISNILTFSRSEEQITFGINRKLNMNSEEQEEDIEIKSQILKI